MHARSAVQWFCMCFHTKFRHCLNGTLKMMPRNLLNVVASFSDGFVASVDDDRGDEVIVAAPTQQRHGHCCHPIIAVTDVMEVHGFATGFANFEQF